MNGHPKKDIELRGEQYKRENNDCTVVALSNLTGMDYPTIHESLKKAGRIEGKPMQQDVFMQVTKATLNNYDLVKIKSPVSVVLLRMNAKKYPGKYLIRIKVNSQIGHVFAMIDGKINDNAMSHQQILGMWKLVHRVTDPVWQEAAATCIDSILSSESGRNPSC